MIAGVAKRQSAGVVGIAVVKFIERRRLPGVNPLDKCEIASMNTLRAKGPTAGQMSGMWGFGAHNVVIGAAVGAVVGAVVGLVFGLVIGLIVGLVIGRQSTVADPASSGTVALM